MRGEPSGMSMSTLPESKLLIKHLAPVISLRASDQSASPWFQSTLHFIAAETSADLPGAPAIVDRLAEVLFIQAMRACIQATYPPGNPNWLRALSDKQIGEALRLMHAEPSRTWTVVELARSVAMSRSAFAERFKELVGETPLDHLTQWRMVRAAGIMLSAKTKRFAEIASTVGYDSESSFGKAFRRVMGVSPGHYRREKRLPIVVSHGRYREQNESQRGDERADDEWSSRAIACHQPS